MGLEMANSVAIADDDEFIELIKNVQKKSNRPMNAPIGPLAKPFAATTCNHMHVPVATPRHF